MVIGVSWGIIAGYAGGKVDSIMMSLRSSSISRSRAGVYVCPPTTPHPPALLTAAASAGPEATFIPAKMTGCFMPSSLVIGVSIV